MEQTDRHTDRQTDRTTLNFINIDDNVFSYRHESVNQRIYVMDCMDKIQVILIWGVPQDQNSLKLYFIQSKM